jgi:arabinofuranan 3-O-arabinosyltransferase
LPRSAAIRLLDDLPRPVATRLVVTTAAGRAVTDTRVTAAAQPLRIPPGTSGWLRVTIAATRGGTPGGPGAGISDVSIPGVRVTSYLRPSQDQPGPAPSFSFQRATGEALGLPGDPPEADLNRTFSTQAAASFGVSAEVAAVPGAALNALLDRLGAAASAQLRISASSTFGSLPALRPQNLLDGAGWIAAGPSATVYLRWNGPKTISEIQLTLATVGIAAEPTRVLITSPAGVRDVPVPSSGILTFPPLVTDQLNISFPGVMPTTAENPLVGTARQLPVGLGSLTVPALASLSTGIPAATASFHLACGQGPPLTVDGRSYPTSVSGTVGDLINLTPLPLRLCTAGAALALPPGQHWLSSPGTGVPLAVTSLSLTDTAPTDTAPTNTAPTAGAATTPRSLRIVSWGTEDRAVTVGPGGLSYLELHQTVNPGWTATLNGHQLTPVTLDGWQQAYVIPAGAGGAVALTFTPAAGYHWLLGASVLALLVLIAGAVWPSRRPGPSAGQAGRAGSVSQAGYWLAAAAATLVLALTGGPVALAVPAVILLGWWRRDLAPWLAFSAMCVAGAFVISGLNHGAEPGFGPFGWPAQAAALIAVAAALTPAVPGPRRRDAAGGDA